MGKEETAMAMTIGFIGTGNMGAALVRAAVKGMPEAEFLLANRTVQKAEKLAASLRKGCIVCNDEVARDSDYIVLGVKPQMLTELFEEIRPVLTAREGRFVLVSMAAGTSCERIAELSGVENCPVIRIMPNTPVSIGAGVIQVCSRNAEESEVETFCQILQPAGMVDRVPESLIDAASAVSGCGPAYAYLFIEALADGGVACGLPRDKALAYAAQMVAGSARMVLESGKHPGALKDAVTSPGGTTIQGVRALEARGFRGAAMEAVIAAYEKTLQMGKK